MKLGVTQISATDKPLLQDTDISLGQLLDLLTENKHLPLVFHYNGKPVKPGYHITEVKAGQFSALDCGANPETWSEIFVQLWDIDEDDRAHMFAGKFSAIIRKVSEHVQLDSAARLTFEVSDGVQPMQIYCAAPPMLHNGALHVTLVPRPASCKPRDRWLADEKREAAVCCGTSSVTENACCS